MQRHPIASRVLGGIATVVLLAGALVLGHSSGLWKVRHTTLASAAPRTVLIAASEKSSPVAAGVIIEQHGLIVTTANSLPAQNRLFVKTTNGLWQGARLVGEDSGSDLAILRINDSISPVQIAPLASKDTTARAIAPSVVAKVSTNSSLMTLDETSTNSAVSLANTMVMSKRSLLPGEALFNNAGELIGLVQNCGATSKEMVVPGELVASVASELAASGHLDHGLLGATVTNVTNSGPGAMVLDVSAHSPAAGVLEPGDIIVALNGKIVPTPCALRDLLYPLAPNTTVHIVVKRGRKRFVAALVLIATP
jgi:serine protease Do